MSKKAAEPGASQNRRAREATMSKKAAEPVVEPAAEPVVEPAADSPLQAYPKMLYVTRHCHQMVAHNAEEEARILAAYKGER
jgi:hypothetical protein